MSLDGEDVKDKTMSLNALIDDLPHEDFYDDKIRKIADRLRDKMSSNWTTTGYKPSMVLKNVDLFALAWTVYKLFYGDWPDGFSWHCIGGVKMQCGRSSDLVLQLRLPASGR